MSESTSRRQWVRAAAYSIIVRDSAILLCRLSAIEREAGYWTLPGGGLDFGEKPHIGMQREVFEETGLKVVDYELLTVDGNLYNFQDSDMYAIQIYYRATVEDTPFAFEVDGTTDECAWIPLEQVPVLPHVSIVAFALGLITN
jgi:8-oxo-dGTP diphosphatase